MLNLVGRYIGKTVLINTAIVVFVLLALSAVFAFIAELDDVGVGNYTVGTAALYILLKIPGSAYELFPPAVLLGSLLGLGALAQHSELTVMRSSGISVWQLVRSVALAGLLLMVVVVLIGEYLMPVSEVRAQQLRSAALSKTVSISARTGYWAKSGKDFVNIKSVLPDMSLIDVRIFQFDNDKLVSLLVAKNAVQQDDGSWLLTGLIRNNYLDNVVTTQTLESESRRSLVNAELLKALSVPVDSMSVRTLGRQISYMRDNQLDSRQVELAWWTKIAIPVSTLVMLLLSLPFVFSSRRSGGAGQKMFTGILLGIGFFLINRLFTNLGLANGLGPAVSTLIPLVLFSIIAFLGLRRVA